METKNLIGMVLAVAISLIVVGTVMMPILTDVQKNIGDEVTYDNTIRTEYEYSLWDGSDFSMEYTYSSTEDNILTINGVDVSDYYFSQLGQRVVIASDVFSARIGGSTIPVLNLQDVEHDAGYSVSFEFTVTDGAYTYSYTDSDSTAVELTGTLGWLVYAEDGGDLGIGQLVTPTSAFYTSDSDDIIVLGNVYTTGENDTFYSYYNGDLTVNSTYADSSEVNISKTLVDGTTDVYSTTLSVTVGDETFTPYFILAPETVTGHESGSVEYSLLGVIPVLVVLAIMMIAVRFVARRD